MGVKRDFIPDPGDLSAAERKAFEQQRRRIAGGVVADFVPDETHELQPPAGHGGDAAIEKALRDQETAIATDFEAAKVRLAQLSDAEAAATIQSMSPERRDLFLIAEAAAGARPAILNAFPPPDPKLVALYTGSYPGDPVEYEPDGDPVAPEADTASPVDEDAPAESASPEDAEPVSAGLPVEGGAEPVVETDPDVQVVEGVEVPVFDPASLAEAALDGDAPIEEPKETDAADAPDPAEED